VAIKLALGIAETTARFGARHVRAGGAFAIAADFLRWVFDAIVQRLAAFLGRQVEILIGNASRALLGFGRCNCGSRKQGSTSKCHGHSLQHYPSPSSIELPFRGGGRAATGGTENGCGA